MNSAQSNPLATARLAHEQPLSSPPEPARPRGLVALLAAMVMVGPLGIDTYLPSMPAIAATYAADPALVQQTLSVFVFTMALTMLFGGTLSDSFGRRPVLLVALALFMVSNLAAVFAPSIGTLILCRAFQGVAAGAGSVIARAIVQDCFKGAEAQRAMAQVMMMFGLAPAIAPIIGGWLHHAFGWRSVFVFLTLGGAVLFAMCFTWLRETLPRARVQPFQVRTILRNYGKALRDVRFVMMCISIGFIFCGIPLYVGAAAPFLMNILHLPETAFAWLFVPLISGVISGSATADRLLKRYPSSSTKLLVLGLTLCLCGAGINVAYTALADVKVPWAVLPIALYTFGMALATPCMVTRTLSRLSTMYGLASSMQGFVQMMIFTVVAGLIAPLLFDSAFKLALGMGIGVSFGILLWICMPRGKVAVA